jgi:hypothetical protein
VAAGRGCRHIADPFREIGQSVWIAGIDRDDTDVTALIKAALCRAKVGRWLLVVDDADDTELFFGRAELSSHLPFNRIGSIFFAALNHDALVRPDIWERGVSSARDIISVETIELLHGGWKENQARAPASTASILAKAGRDPCQSCSERCKKPRKKPGIRLDECPKGSQSERF